MKDFNREEMEKEMLNYIPDEGIRKVLLDNYSAYRSEGFYLGVCDRLFELRPSSRFDDLKEMYSYIRNFYSILSACDFEEYLCEIYSALERHLVNCYLCNDGFALTKNESGVYLLVKEA